MLDVVEHLVSPLGNDAIQWVSFQYNLVAIRHMLQASDPNVRQASIYPLAVMVLQERFNSLLPNLFEFTRMRVRHLLNGLCCHYLVPVGSAQVHTEIPNHWHPP